MKYLDLFLGIDGIKFQEIPSRVESSYWFVSVVMEKPFPSAAVVSEKLLARGIDSRPFFTPMSELPFYNDPKPFPVSKMLAERGISLPSGASLKNREIEFICSELKKIAGK